MTRSAYTSSELVLTDDDDNEFPPQISQSVLAAELFDSSNDPAHSNENTPERENYEINIDNEGAKEKDPTVTPHTSGKQKRGWPQGSEKAKSSSACYICT
jgi:hypothetical protein